MTDYTATGAPAQGSRGVSQLVRTEFTLIETAINSKANIASPAFTGTPTAPTATIGDSSTQIATTAFVAATAFSSVLPGQAGNAGKFLTTDGAAASFSTDFGIGINFARATVASHATTADIWTDGNEIDFTGTATVTDFADAPVAGASRTLHIAAACTITHGGNISVQGGATITCQAGDILTVHALTTGTFRVAFQSVTVAPRKIPVFSSEASTLEPMGPIPDIHMYNRVLVGTDKMSVTYCPAIDLFVAANSVTSTANCWTSPGTDGETWTSRSWGAISTVSLSSSDDALIAIDRGGTTMRRSTDGITWTNETVGTLINNQDSVAVGLDSSQVWLALQAGTAVLRSTDDGNNWVANTLPATPGYDALFVLPDGATFWFESGGNGYTSTTGATSSWTSNAMPYTPLANHVWQDIDRTIYISDGLTTMHKSTDGVTWTEMPNIFSNASFARRPNLLGVNGVLHFYGNVAQWADHQPFWIFNGKPYPVPASLTANRYSNEKTHAISSSGILLLPADDDGYINVIDTADFTSIFG